MLFEPECVSNQGYRILKLFACYIHNTALASPASKSPRAQQVIPTGSPHLGTVSLKPPKITHNHGEPRTTKGYILLPIKECQEKK
jgi:hypothetical protein